MDINHKVSDKVKEPSKEGAQLVMVTSWTVSAVRFTMSL
jgi:hypothetical protein